MVDSVGFDASNKPILLTLRNLYGSYVTLTEVVQLHFLIGRANRYDVLY